MRPDDRIGIVFSDITRPTPNRLILPVVLAELSHVPRAHITLFNAIGTHRPNSDAELRDMLGDGPVDWYRIVQNDAFDPATQVFARGRPLGAIDIWINREIAACDVKILTGFIEPHFFAGFSGGRKAIMPGMAGRRTVLGNHDAAMIADANATWGVTRGNPIWEEMMEVARAVGAAFLVNVTLNRDKEITGVFAGDLDAAHAAGLRLRQEHRDGAGGRAVRHRAHHELRLPARPQPVPGGQGDERGGPGGAAGGGDHRRRRVLGRHPGARLYGEAAARGAPSGHLLERDLRHPDFLKQDQWQAQIQAQIQAQGGRRTSTPTT